MGSRIETWSKRLFVSFKLENLKKYNMKNKEPAPGLFILAYPLWA